MEIVIIAMYKWKKGYYGNPNWKKLRIVIAMCKRAKLGCIIYANWVVLTIPYM
jgi:hypothetical protein